MKYRMAIKRQLPIYLVLFLVLIAAMPLWADWATPPNPPRLVVDRTATLNNSQLERLEVKLVNYNDTTSTQISVVLLPDLEGYDIADLAFRIGEKWGVGRQGFNNGILILVRPKTITVKGKAFIAVGYGLEAVIPDAIAKRIVEREMIPAFEQNRYFEGLDQATDTIIGLASGLFTADSYDKLDPLEILIPLLIFLLIFIVMIKFGNNSTHISRKGTGEIPYWLYMMMQNQSGRSHSGSWGGFSGGSSGSRGGFGGFGGGSFGGGGAGGSW